MAPLSPTSLVGQIRELTSTITNLLALAIASSFVYLIVDKLARCCAIQRKKLLSDISLLLPMNTLLILITRSTFQFVDIDLNTIRRNYLSVTEFHDSFACRLRAYLLLSIHNTLYWSYALKALFRITRIFFPMRLRLHRSTTYLYVFIPAQLLLGFGSTLPMWVTFNAIYLLPNQPYCTASYDELASLIYMPIVAFVLPLTIISVSYLSIVLKMRRVSMAASAYQSRNRRDFVVIRRIVIIISVLSMVSLPIFIDLFIHLPTGRTNPDMNSIAWMSSSVNAVVLVSSLPFVNPKMRALFRRSNSIGVQLEGRY